MSTPPPLVSIVIPLFNEESTLPLLTRRLNTLADSLSFSVEFVMVDDGSKDKTAAMMTDLKCGARQGVRALAPERQRERGASLSMISSAPVH